MICHKLVNGVVARARRAATAWAPPRADAAVILCTKYVLLHTYRYVHVWHMDSKGGTMELRGELLAALSAFSSFTEYGCMIRKLFAGHSRITL